jgi:hypothetical protein
MEIIPLVEQVFVKKNAASLHLIFWRNWPVTSYHYHPYIYSARIADLTWRILYQDKNPPERRRSRLQRRAPPERGSGTEHFQCWVSCCGELAAYQSSAVEPRLSAGFSASEHACSVTVAWVPVPAAAACRGIQTGDEVAVNRDYFFFWATWIVITWA